jgi:hypothetical protein
MGTHTPPVEASHTNHHWFTQLQAEPTKERAWVRILRLEAGRLGDPLSGRLTVEELNATEPFDALSYCCGPSVLSCSITVNGASGFRITRNLWTALQRVRKTDSDRRIWVDAVCIDQEDEREKSSQVRHMHAVYSLAEEVCIYLGECRTRQYRESMRVKRPRTIHEYVWTRPGTGRGIVLHVTISEVCSRVTGFTIHRLPNSSRD